MPNLSKAQKNYQLRLSKRHKKGIAFAIGFKRSDGIKDIEDLKYEKISKSNLKKIRIGGKNSKRRK